ncbi:peptide chain release factor N(5)-glutamine methyltransferase [Fulvimarina sp. MAC3]|uniref:peptide chain release factor N(5)-glutamine methyltransferase n=1 Tax=Fulvimarina sp. MAC3 TaxID=3148887 RepID=UPI0031FC4DDA
MTDRTASPTIGDVLRSAVRQLNVAGIADAELDARFLMAGALDIETSTLLARRERAIEPQAKANFSGFIARRLAGEPVHRILGRRGFYGRDFELSSGTLEPRPDTEIVVEMGIAFLKSRKRTGPLRFLDIGTGSGVIALSILAELPVTTGVATDISEDALATARRNAERLQVGDRFEAFLAEYTAGIAGPLDLVVSNPPYVPTRDIEGLSSEVRDYDPRAALDGGQDGLDAYRAIASETRGILAEGGSVILEIGYDQQDTVSRIFEGQGFTLSEWKMDYGGVVRALRFI